MQVDQSLRGSTAHELTNDSRFAQDVDRLLAMMGGKQVAPLPSFAPCFCGVGEEVWDPSVVNSSETIVRASPNVALELLRCRALRRLQATVERAVLDEVGDRVGRRLELLSRVTLRNGNGLVDRWLASRRLVSTVDDDPLLPPAHNTAADVPVVVDELTGAGATPAAALKGSTCP